MGDLQSNPQQTGVNPLPSSLFFPAHDLALANGVRHYIAPRAAVRLQQDLNALSQWWQREDNATNDNPGNNSIKTTLPLPWGWNYNTRSALLEAGFDSAYLPTDQDLKLLRTISHRGTSIEIIRQCQNNPLQPEHHSFDTVGSPLYITHVSHFDKVFQEKQEHQSLFLLKSPWSSSGRGLCWSRAIPSDLLYKRGCAIIREMGGVIMENEYDKIQDFAMLFYVGKEKVEFIGYSIFDTDRQGTYRNGLMMSDSQMEEHLAQYVLLQDLIDLKRLYTQQILPNLFAPFFGKSYPIGYIGIDMMIFADEKNNYQLHPCIEINVRCTMGVVARRIFDQYVSPQSKGVFVIEHAIHADLLKKQQEKLTHDHPLVYSDDRIRSGFYPLTPITEQSQFAAYILIREE